MRERLRDVCWAPRGMATFWAQCGWDGGTKGWMLLPRFSTCAWDTKQGRISLSELGAEADTCARGGEWT